MHRVCSVTPPLSRVLGGEGVRVEALPDGGNEEEGKGEVGNGGGKKKKEE